MKRRIRQKKSNKISNNEELFGDLSDLEVKLNKIIIRKQKRMEKH
jgi:hypothetical protein